MSRAIQAWELCNKLACLFSIDLDLPAEAGFPRLLTCYRRCQRHILKLSFHMHC